MKDAGVFGRGSKFYRSGRCTFRSRHVILGGCQDSAYLDQALFFDLLFGGAETLTQQQLPDLNATPRECKMSASPVLVA